MRIFPLLVPGLLALLTACGGSTSTQAPGPVAPAVPSALGYTDPAGSGWRLVKDASSTPTRLVLGLVGPAGLKCRGVGINVQGAAGMKFGTFTDAWPAQDAGVFELKQVVVDPLDPPANPEPVFFGAGIKPGNLLTVGCFQKDRRATAKAVTAPVLRIALELDAAKASGMTVGTALALSVTKARILPEDIGAMNSTVDMLTKAQLEDIQVALGKVTLQ